MLNKAKKSTNNDPALKKTLNGGKSVVEMRCNSFKLFSFGMFIKVFI